MRYEVRYTSPFKRDFKKAKRQRKDVAKLTAVLALLGDGKPLPERNRNHPLGGDWVGKWECHLDPDWLLIYTYDKTALVLHRLGTHSELFN